MDDVQNTVDEDFAVSAKHGGCIYFLDTFCRMELDDIWLIKRPEGGIIGVG